MSEGARVESIDAIKAFRGVLFKFAETAGGALGDAEAELHRVHRWVDMEQTAYWTDQYRKRGEAVSKAKEAVRYKKVFKNAVGGRDSVVDEEKALALAERRLEEAEQKVAACRSWSRRLLREIQNYKGNVQRFATTIDTDVPTAAAKLERMITLLEGYVNLAAPMPEITPGMLSPSESIAPAAAPPEEAVSPPAAVEPAPSAVPAGDAPTQAATA